MICLYKLGPVQQITWLKPRKISDKCAHQLSGPRKEPEEDEVVMLSQIVCMIFNGDFQNSLRFRVFPF